jgi:hypothetical protein
MRPYLEIRSLQRPHGRLYHCYGEIPEKKKKAGKEGRVCFGPTLHGKI